MSDPQHEEQRKVRELDSQLRELVHEINNPLGIIRMATYFLENSRVDESKRLQYYRAINENIDKVEDVLKRLRELRETLVSNPEQESRGPAPQ